MKQVVLRVLLAVGALAWAVALDGAAQDKKGDKKEGKAEVVIEDLKALPPKDWKKEKPANTFRKYQYRLPAAEGDKDDAELFVSDQLIGKSDADIIERWKKAFVLPDGKKYEDISKVEKSKVGKLDVTTLDIEGVYLYKKLPIDPDFKAVQKPGYRMVRVILPLGDGYYVSLTGPSKTVAHHKKAFDDWIKAFK